MKTIELQGSIFIHTDSEGMTAPAVRLEDSIGNCFIGSLWKKSVDDHLNRVKADYEYRNTEAPFEYKITWK